jgi:hypothetical protein
VAGTDLWLDKIVGCLALEKASVRISEYHLAAAPPEKRKRRRSVWHGEPQSPF